jgi:hypothetical protein
MTWRAWFKDGSSVTSAESSWQDLPADGLVILKVWRDGRKELYCGLDAIWWDGDGRVYQLDLPPTVLRVARREAKAGQLKYGVLIPNEDYERIYHAALTAKE